MDRTNTPSVSRGVPIAIVALLAAGFTLSLAAFYPGYMTIDAEWVYKQPLNDLGDWQSPVMVWLWGLISGAPSIRSRPAR